MLVRISTDGSYSGQYQVGGWACRIQHFNFMVHKSGRIPGNVSDSNTCELYAIAQALKLLAERVELKDCEIIFSTDSLVSIQLIKGGTRNREFSILLQDIKWHLDRVESFTFQHVKGHSWIRGHPEYSKPQYFANMWCDQWAHRRMKAAEKYEVKQREIRNNLKKTKKRKAVKPRVLKHSHRVKGKGAGGYKRPRSKLI